MNRKFKRVLITGITGAGGSYLAEYICKKEKNIKIFGTYRSKGYLNLLKIKYKNKIKFFKINLNNFKKTLKIIKKIKPDLIVHLASDARVRKSFDEPLKVINNNNNITLNVLESIRLSGIDPIILICSTSEVYGRVKKSDTPIDEKQIMNPVNPYSVSKAFQDLVSQMYYTTYKLRIIITRMFTYINPRQKYLFQTAFTKQIVDIENGKKKVLQHGNLNSVRNFIDTEDAMKAYWLTAKRGKVGEIYNIGGNKVLSVKKFLSKLIKFSNVKIKTTTNKKLLRPADVSFQIPNSNKFRKRMRWNPQVSLELSIIKLFNYFRKNK